MIKINLLENSKGKGKRGGSAAPSMPTMEMGDMGSPKLKVLAIVVIVGLANLGYWYRLDHETQAIAAKMKVAEQKNRELADVKARFLERQTQANAYQRRVDVIKQLHEGQTVIGIVRVQEIAREGEKLAAVFRLPGIVEAVVFGEPVLRIAVAESRRTRCHADLSTAELARDMHHLRQVGASVDAPSIENGLMRHQ